MPFDTRRADRRTLQLRALVFTTFAVGIGLLGFALAELMERPVDLLWHDRMPGLLGLTLLTMAAGHVRIRVPGQSATVSVSEIFAFLTAYHLGSAAAIVSLAVDGLYNSLRQRRPNVLRAAFNVGEPIVSIGVAGLLAAIVPDVFPSARAGSHFIGSIPALVSIYFALNTGLTAVAVGLEAGVSPFEIWKSHALYTGANYYAAAAVAALTVDPVDGIDIRVIAIVVPLAALSYLVLRTASRQVEQSQQHIRDLDDRYLATVEALAIAVDVKDDVTHGHVRRVQLYSTALARALGVREPEALKAIDTAGLLHDVGKITVPDRVLQKPGRLSVAEFDTMKQHADTGARILEQVRFPYPVVPIVRHHHEKWDGTGYPDGLSGEDIPLGARILTVVDCFDALTSDRPYRRRLTDDEAAAMLMAESGTHFDPMVVDAFVPIIPALRAIISEDATDPLGLRPLIKPVPQFAVPDPTAAAVASLFESHAAIALLQLRRLRPGSELCCYAIDPVADRLLPAYVSPLLHDARVVQPLPMGERLSGWVAAHRQTVSNTDPRLDLGETARLLRLEQATSVPVFRGGAMAGVFTVYAQGSERFSDRDVAQLWRLAQETMAAGPTLVPRGDFSQVWRADTPPMLEQDESSSRLRSSGLGVAG